MRIVLCSTIRERKQINIADHRSISSFVGSASCYDLVFSTCKLLCYVADYGSATLVTYSERLRGLLDHETLNHMGQNVGFHHGLRQSLIWKTSLACYKPPSHTSNKHTSSNREANKNQARCTPTITRWKCLIYVHVAKKRVLMLTFSIDNSRVRSWSYWMFGM